jgi:transmembrane sensor
LTSEAGEAPSPDDTIRATAVTWLARLRAPDSADHHEGFEAWYAADPRHADIYDEVLASWENMALAAQTPAAEPARRQTARAADRRPSASWMAAGSSR